MADYTIKQDDTWPPIEATLSDADGPIDLTTAGTIKIVLRKSGNITPDLEEECTIVNAITGKVSYEWAAGDTAVAGSYDGEFEITWSDLTVETVPNSGYFSLEIKPDLN